MLPRVEISGEYGLPDAAHGFRPVPRSFVSSVVVLETRSTLNCAYSSSHKASLFIPGPSAPEKWNPLNPVSARNSKQLDRLLPLFTAMRFSRIP